MIAETKGSMNAYRAFGRAHPERQGWRYDVIQFGATTDAGPAWELLSGMEGSQFHASLKSRVELDPMDAKVEIEQHVRSMMDTVGLFMGAAVDCEVISLETPAHGVL